jgi:hypothetical protein
MKRSVQNAVVSLLNYRGQKLRGVVFRRTEKNAHARKAIVAACKEIKRESLIFESETV